MRRTVRKVKKPIVLMIVWLLLGKVVYCLLEGGRPSLYTFAVAFNFMNVWILPRNVKGYLFMLL